MTNQSDIYSTAFLDEEAMNPLTIPLLKEPIQEGGEEVNDDEIEIPKKSMLCFELSALMLGVLMGFFLQGLIIVGEVASSRYWGFALSTPKGMFLRSSLFSLLITAMVGAALLLMTSLVSIPFNAVVKKLVALKKIPVNAKKYEGALEDLILSIESRFCVGCMMGATIAWTITDLSFGCPVKLGWSLATLVMTIVWCHIAMTQLDKSTRNEREKNNKKYDNGKIGGTSTKKSSIMLV